MRVSSGVQLVQASSTRTYNWRLPVNLKGQRVTVMGLGLFGGGVGAVRFLVREGAVVTVTDLRPKKTYALRYAP